MEAQVREPHEQAFAGAARGRERGRMGAACEEGREEMWSDRRSELAIGVGIEEMKEDDPKNRYALRTIEPIQSCRGPSTGHRLWVDALRFP